MLVIKLFLQIWHLMIVKMCTKGFVMALTVTATLTADWLHNVVKYKLDTIKLFGSNYHTCISIFEYNTTNRE